MTMNKSITRRQCEDSVLDFVSKIIAENIDMESKKVLYVGIGGDPLPKGEYSPFFPESYEITTLDTDAQYKPDIIGDITKPPSDMDRLYDVVIMVQVIEHIPNLFDVATGLNYVLKSGGFAIVDCPWNYPYHPEAPSFGDYWRITRDGFVVLFADYFEIMDLHVKNNNTSVLLRKL